VAKRKAEPLFQALGNEAGQFPKWNFHKYLLDRDGKIVGSFGSTVTPDNVDLVKKIESLL
jgi:glutathione peroxidase